MRKTRYKVWDKILKKMRSVQSIQFTPSGDITKIYVWVTNWLYIAYEPDRFILMQCTDFEDSLGNEVWEGDVVQDNIHEEGGDVYYIKYDPREGCYKAFDGYGAAHPVGVWLTLSHLSFKVIGNLYENPELMEEVNE